MFVFVSSMTANRERFAVPSSPDTSSRFRTVVGSRSIESEGSK
jgi:hypothetical protein